MSHASASARRPGTARHKPPRARPGRGNERPRPRTLSTVLRMRGVGMKAYAPDPWRVRNLPSPCPRPFAARQRSCGRIRRPLNFRPEAPLVSVQTGRWYLPSLDCTYSLTTPTPLPFSHIVGGRLYHSLRQVCGRSVPKFAHARAVNGGRRCSATQNCRDLGGIVGPAADAEGPAVRHTGRANPRSGRGFYC